MKREELVMNGTFVRGVDEIKKAYESVEVNEDKLRRIKGR